MWGGVGDDRLYGEAGHDYLMGGDGADELYGGGGGGGDTLDGGAGADYMEGGSGRTTYIVDNVNDVVVDNDVSAAAWNSLDEVYTTVSYALTDNSGIELLSVEYIPWSNPVDFITLTGNKFNNTIFGGGGADILYGGGGADVLYGNGGNDTLDGGTGNDVLLGGEGDDLYTFSSNPQDNTFAYFNQGRIDLIEDDPSVHALDGQNSTNDVLQLNGLSLSDVVISNRGHALLIEVTATGELIQIDEFYRTDSVNGVDLKPYVIETLRFADGDVSTASLLSGYAPSAVASTADDIITVDNAGAAVAIDGLRGNDVIFGGASDDVITGGEGHDLLTGGMGNDILLGGAGLDRLYGAAGNDTLGGGAGSDGLYGGSGNDTYRYGVGDGDDAIFDVTAGLRLGGLQDINEYGYANYVSDDPERAGGYDTIELLGLNPSDVELNRAPSDIDHFESLVITIKSSGERLLINGQNADDPTNPGSYLYRIERIVFADGTEWGVAEILANTGGELQPLPEPPAPTAATEGDDILYGTVLSDNHMINDMSDPQHAIDGLGGNDTIIMLTGDDMAFGGSGNDTLNGNAGNDILVGGTGSDLVNGDAGDDTLLDASVDMAAGQFVADSDAATIDMLQGGAGNDAYVVMNSNTVITENASEGVDAVLTNIETTVLGDNIENLYMSYRVLPSDTGGSTPAEGSGPAVPSGPAMGNGDNAMGVGMFFNSAIGAPQAVTAVGNALDNLMMGNSLDNTLYGLDGNDRLYGEGGNDLLDGGAGADYMEGGDGSDIYVVDSSADVVVEVDNGVDLWDEVQSSVSFDASALNGIDNLTLTGEDNINAIGNDQANILLGNNGNNLLDGGSNADFMAGGAGDDVYRVDDMADVVVENENEGVDTVEASITYTLGDNVENLLLTGSAAIDGTGNALNNSLTGNSADNTLNGGAGIDTMAGGAGNDTYVVDSSADVVVENANEGIDTVQSSVSYSLNTASAANVENITLTGSGAISATGNALANVLDGSQNQAANTLSGGTGNDTYYVGRNDMVLEGGNGGGIDTVYSATSYTLSSGVENATLTGTASGTRLTGNALDNVLEGNSGNNVLSGNAGADTLHGGAGTDSLLGGTGNDTYILNRGDYRDTINDRDTTVANTDVAQFGAEGAAINHDQLWFAQSGNDLVIKVMGSTDQFTISNGMLANNSSYHVEEFRTSDGYVLREAQMANLVNAMSSAGSQPAGTGIDLANMSQNFQDTFAASWQTS